MNEHLREINRSLRALDDAHLNGHITRDEYRLRRRHLLGTLRDGGGITRRNNVPSAETVPHMRDRQAPAKTPRRRRDDAVSAMFPKWTRWFDVRRWFGRRR